MAVPNIVPRPEHAISRRDIDPDALKVLYRLHRSGYVAYLVGGSVRDLLLSRRPKDFDIGTSAHPYRVKRLFRNCWIIGRRFRLAHVKFGSKTIEVATFRRQVTPGTEAEPPEPDRRRAESRTDEQEPGTSPTSPTPAPAAPDRLIHRDNTFGTPEEDAFRRDFTINALFYEIGTFSVIDYVHGLDDLKAGVIRCIGDPAERFLEDPVRMLRAIALSARLDFAIESQTLRAIRRHRKEIARSAPARMIEELYKILRSGAAEIAFQRLGEVGLLEPIAPELCKGDPKPLRASLARLDAYRQRSEALPETLKNSVLLGSLLVPRGFTAQRPPREVRDGRRRPAPVDVGLGSLPVARRDVELLRQILGLQPRLADRGASPRSRHALTHRTAFMDALVWLEIHGESELVADWRSLASHDAPPAGSRPARRRPRRRRRKRVGS